MAPWTFYNSSGQQLNTRVAPTTTSIWVQPHAVEGTGTLAASDNRYGLTILGSNSAQGDAHFSVAIPTGFTTLTKAVVVIKSPEGANGYIDITTEWGATGEAKGANTDSIGSAAVGLTADEIYDHDVSAALTSLAAGDRVGMQYTRKGDNAADTITTLHVLGLLLEYY